MLRAKMFLIFLLLVVIFSAPAFAQFDMQLIATMQGDTDGVSLGIHLAGVGDINHDGIEDLAVSQYGKTFIYFGSKNFDTIPDIIFPFSSGYICHGDVNSDGIQDLLLTRFSLLSVYIYFGGSPFDTVPDKILVAPDTISPPYTAFGWKIAVGDINKDGYDDLAIHGNNNRVYLYLGGANMSTSPAYILQGPPNYFGSDGLAIGDVNGDGYGDLAVSTSGHYPDDSTYIYFGGVQLDTMPTIKLRGGFIILGDVNGDGYEDIITGIGTYFGGAVIDSIIDSPLRVTVNARVIGNFNKDIYQDLLWGSPSVAGGDAYIYLGSDPLDTIEDWHHYDSEVGDYGAQVGSTDINGDGVDEAIVGDPGWWWAHPDAPIGRVYIYKNPYTTVEEWPSTVPHDFELGQNYPNPFNSSTIIPFSLKAQGSLLKGSIHTTLVIYNLLGQKIRTLVDEEKLPGEYRIVWDGKDNSGKEVPAGIYFYRLRTEQFSDSKKLLLIK